MLDKYDRTLCGNKQMIINANYHACLMTVFIIPEDIGSNTVIFASNKITVPEIAKGGVE